MFKTEKGQDQVWGTLKPENNMGKCYVVFSYNTDYK